MNFREFLKNNLVYLDGGMGTLLQKKGLKAGEKPEKWNISHPEIIKEIHKSYYDAGSNVVCTNTFGANSLKYTDNELEEIIKAAVNNAQNARNESKNNSEKFVALDIGPLGKLLKPLGELDFEYAVSIFAKIVKIGAKYGVDLVLIETMNDSYETKAALLAVKENCDLPVIVSNAYSEDGKLMTGATPTAMVALLEGMGVDALGANCSLGPKKLFKVAMELVENASVPVMLKPNAGLPKIVNGQTVFDVFPKEFAEDLAEIVKKGVRIVGGCCGTTSEYIKELYNKTYNISPVPVTNKNVTMVSCYSHAIKFMSSPILIGERINPTGKKRLKQALLENDMDYILSEGVNQEEKGVHILDVNVGLPDINEEQMLQKAVFELQSVTNLPLQIDTANINAMEKALRIYNGKPMINSVNGKKESMEAVFPLVKKYGGLVVALTLDENGIPDTADGRVEIAKKILSTAKEYGIDKKNIIFDTLVMTISADNNSANTTLKALSIIKNEFGCHTSLGVSNVSFGLPNRETINGVFFALALENGLSAAIMNPCSIDMMKTYYSFKALKGMDENCLGYIGSADKFVSVAKETVSQTETVQNSISNLQTAIIKGFKEKAGEETRNRLRTQNPLDIVNAEIIPALDIVGVGFENKTIFLPQLLMSAEAAKVAFEVIKYSMLQETKEQRGKVVIATVHGDIHDIGKNIVKLLLENYGFDVLDLGKDVEPQKVVEAAKEIDAKLVGLSALMTTTVPAMEETIKLLKKEVPNCKIVVGGAVLTKEYAEKIGADKYAKDAMETVRYAEMIFK